MKFQITENDNGFFIHMQAETIADASQLTRMSLNVKGTETYFGKEDVSGWMCFPVNPKRKRTLLKK